MFTPNYELEDVRTAAKIVSELLLQLKDRTKIGVNLLDLEEYAETFIALKGATPYNLGYHPAWAPCPFPSILCININDEAVHAPARNYIIKDGDIVNYDVGVRYKTGCGDAAITIGVGEITARDKELLKITAHALQRATSMLKPGMRADKIGAAIDLYVRGYGMRPVQGFGGHRIGEEMHEKPFIPNEKGIYVPALLEAGMVVCLEPVITWADGASKKMPDGWTVKTANGQNVAQFENMVLITPKGYQILTSHL